MRRMSLMSGYSRRKFNDDFWFEGLRLQGFIVCLTNMNSRGGGSI